MLRLFPVVLLCALPLLAAPRPYHLQLEAYPAAPFPFLNKFGKVTIDVYGGGLRAETFWLNGFSRNHSPSVTLENPIGRMYTDVPIDQLSEILTKLSSSFEYRHAVPDTPIETLRGKVSGIDATRHRLRFGTAWVDLWTTTTLPENPQFRSIVTQFIAGLSPGTAALAKTIPGTPIYVELNFRRFKKVALLKVKKLTFTNEGEKDALKVGKLYFRAPLIDAIWK